MAKYPIQPRPRRSCTVAAFCAAMIIVALTAGCAPLPTAVSPAPAAATPPVGVTRPPEPPTVAVAPSPIAGGKPQPAARALPDPRTDPAAALRYSGFPAGLGSVVFDYTSRLVADPAANYFNSPEIERVLGKLNVRDLSAGKADMELHEIGSVARIDLISLDDRTWAQIGGSPWEEIGPELIESTAWQLGGVWQPLALFEGFDAATEVSWVEDKLLNGEPAHHLHVTFDPAKMQHLEDTLKVRWEYYTEPLLDSHYGTATVDEVTADVWLAAKDLSVKQIDTLIRVVTQEDESGSDKTNWTITRTLKLEASDPNAIVALEIPASVRATEAAAPQTTKTATTPVATSVAQTDSMAHVPPGELHMGSAEEVPVTRTPTSVELTTETPGPPGRFDTHIPGIGTGPLSGQDHVLRGGSWLSTSRVVRSALRGHLAPDNWLDDVGFRCAGSK